MKACWTRAASFARDCRGTTLVAFGLALPLLATAVAATVEYSSLASRKSKLQKAADGAALAGAQQLRLSNSTDGTVDSIVKATVQTLAPTPQDSATTVSSAVLDKRSSVQVTIREVVPTVLGKLMSLPTMDLQAAATAKISGVAKLCLLTLDPSQSKTLNLDKNSLLTAPGCAVYSNSKDPSGLSANTNAQATAAVICSAGGVDNKGAILSPSPTTDCPVMADPLASMPRPASGSCTATALKIGGSQTLWPGTYCLGLEIVGSAQVTLMPGVYTISDGPFLVSDTATLSGQNVGFYFTGDKSGLRFSPGTSINLTAPKDGQMAGLLLFEDRSATMRDYRITSNNAPNLLGTLYIPGGRLIVDSNKSVAQKSAFTVIVARQLDLNSGPNLYLNTDYYATDIPVPDGVGPKTGGVALAR